MMKKLVLQGTEVWRKSLYFLPKLVSNKMIEEIIDKIKDGYGLEAHALLAAYNSEIILGWGPQAGAVLDKDSLIISPNPEFIVTLSKDLEIRFENPILVAEGLMRIWLASMRPRVIYQARDIGLRKAIIETLTEVKE